MKGFQVFALCTGLLASLAGCGEHTRWTANYQGVASWSYLYKFNGCETGEHSFTSLEDYCTALQSESQNNQCARAAREDEFRASCPGTFEAQP